MRIDELTGYKDKPEFQAVKKAFDHGEKEAPGIIQRTRARDRFSELLRKNGWELVNFGYHATVFTHPGIDYVIKLFHFDNGYLSFVRFAQSQPENPHLPKFRGKIMKVDNELYAVRMERLTECPPNMVHALNFMGEILDDQDGDMNIDDWIQWYKKSGQWPKVKAVVEANEDILYTIEELKHLAQEEGVNPDLHEGNFMMRGQTLVIIDPFQNG